MTTVYLAHYDSEDSDSSYLNAHRTLRRAMAACEQYEGVGIDGRRLVWVYASDGEWSAKGSDGYTFQVIPIMVMEEE